MFCYLSEIDDLDLHVTNPNSIKTIKSLALTVQFTPALYTTDHSLVTFSVSSNACKLSITTKNTNICFLRWGEKSKSNFYWVCKQPQNTEQIKEPNSPNKLWHSTNTPKAEWLGSYPLQVLSKRYKCHWQLEIAIDHKTKYIKPWNNIWHTW